MYGFLLLILLHQFHGVYCAIVDPCPDTVQATTVVDMCTDSVATELPEFGNNDKDSVVLRMMKYENNCNCFVNIDNQQSNKTLNIIPVALPAKQNECGLQIDIEHVPAGNTDPSPMSCMSDKKTMFVPLSASGSIKFTSKFIAGNFAEGFCIQIITSRNTAPSSSSSLTIRCSLPSNQGITSTTVTSPSATSKPSSTPLSSKQTEKEETTTKTSLTSPSKTPEPSIPSTMSRSPISPSSKQTESTSQSSFTGSSEKPRPPSSTRSSTNTQKETKKTSDSNAAMYIGIGAGIIFIFLLLIAVIISYRQRKSSEKDPRQEHLVKDRDYPNFNSPVNHDFEGVHDNALYIPSDQEDNLEGDIITVESEKPVSTQMEGNHNIVDNGLFRTTDDQIVDSHTEPSIQQNPSEHNIENGSINTNSSFGSMRVDPSNEYAVVNKSKDNTDSIPTDTSNLYAVVNKTKDDE